MKKIFLVTATLLLFATYSFAAWSPTPLEIYVEDEIIYAFDGSDVDITFDVSSKPARCWLVINTRLPEDQLPHQVTNGFLGWHYVNRIDTTVYVSKSYSVSPGVGHTITWDGYGTENTSGGYGGTYERFDKVSPGTYDYYIWAYDDQSPREKACNFLPISFYWQPQYTKFCEYDEVGLPLDNPLIWGIIPWMYDNLHRGALYDDDGNFVEWLDEPVKGKNSYGPPRWTAFKLPLGADPDDMSKLQTSFCPGFSQEDQYDCSPNAFDPGDQDYFYMMHVFVQQKTGDLFKWHWVGDGNAERIDDWSGLENIRYTTASRRGMGEFMEEVQTDTEYIYIASPGRNPYEYQHDWLWCVDFDGNKVFDQLLDDFYMPDNPEVDNLNGQVRLMYCRREFPGRVILGGDMTCVFELADAKRIIAGEGDDEYLMWKNVNGDYFLDASWDPLQSEYHWNCNTDKYRNINMGRRDTYFLDSEGFGVCFASYQGIFSFVVVTQDGSGIAYCKFGDDTSASAYKKGAGHNIDVGSQFDGLYIGDVVSVDSGYGPNTQHVNWVAFDSAHGLITDKPVAVEEEVRVAFSLDAAYPNPANPTTTIGFTLAEAGYVTVDIYNIAGQKVNTLMDDWMSAGKHSVLWDGSGFSAGVYFYTVTSGNFSKTMKITLLK